MNTILFGDARDSIKQFKENGLVARTIVTSPPYYGLRSYLDDTNPNKSYEIGNEQTPQQFIQNLVEVFRECRDILADDGTLWVNLGDSYYNYRPGVGQRQGKQSITNQKFSEVEDCAKRGNRLDGYKEKDLMGLPWELAFALRNDGWYLRQDIIWAKGISGQTRVGGGMPESVQDRCTKSHEYIFLLSKNKKYYYDIDSVKEKTIASDNVIRDRISGKNNNTPGKQKSGGLQHNQYETGNMRSVWHFNPKPYSGAHFAVYPQELITPCILAGSEVGDIVFDPFMGSATTAEVALRLGRRYAGCELNIEYKKLQDERISSIINEINHTPKELI